MSHMLSYHHATTPMDARPARRPLSISVNTRSLTSIAHLANNEDYSPASSISRRDSRRGSRQSGLISSASFSSATTSPFAAVTGNALSYSGDSPYEDSNSSTVAGPSLGSFAPKLKGSRLRKMSDQGALDLSKSRADSDGLTGLGIKDLRGVRSNADLSYGYTTRMKHGRTTSIGSQTSNASSSIVARPGMPFTHPMKQTPRPYTPPPGATTPASPEEEDEIDETKDLVDTNTTVRHPSSIFPSRRSVSISSASATQQPTPLSRTYTAEQVSSLARTPANNASQTNLSIKSGHSGSGNKPSKLKKVRPSQPPPSDLPRSYIEYSTSPSTRTSFEKALSFVGRRSESEMGVTQEELVLAARRKFEEKEAMKEQKLAQEALRRREMDAARSAKKQERERRRSDAAAASSGERPSLSIHRDRERTSSSTEKRRFRKDSGVHTTNTFASTPPSDSSISAHTRSYDSYKSTTTTSSATTGMTIPSPGTRKGAGGIMAPGFFANEKNSVPAAPMPILQSDDEAKKEKRRAKRRSGRSAVGLSWWFHTRVLSCGGRD